jgi:hypothetical protein
MAIIDKYLLGYEETAQAADCIDADCNGDSNIDIDDVMLFAQYVFGGFITSPCQPCENVMEVGKWYIVEDTVYSRAGMFSVGDSVFSFLDRWVTKDSIYIKSMTSISGINLDAWIISDTTYLGLVEYYLELPDTSSESLNDPTVGGSN